MEAILISADEIKKALPGYAPERASEFHESSARLADKRFQEYLKKGGYEMVILMSGGPASGKTEYVSEYLMDKNFLILDGILPTRQGAEIKIRKARDANKPLAIHAVLPQDLRQAYVAFLHRDRKFADSHFFEKHSSARSTLLNIAKKYSEIEIRVIESAYREDDLMFEELLFDGRESLIAFLEKIQYSIDEVVRLVTS